MFIVSSCSCLCAIYWSQVLSREWRCSWCSADRRCSNCIWVINNFLAYWGVAYSRCFTVILRAARASHASRNQSTMMMMIEPCVDGIVQDCSISSSLAMEILQSCTKPLISWQYFNLGPSYKMWQFVQHKTGAMWVCLHWYGGTWQYSINYSMDYVKQSLTSP